MELTALTKQKLVELAGAQQQQLAQLQKELAAVRGSGKGAAQGSEEELQRQVDTLTQEVADLRAAAARAIAAHQAQVAELQQHIEALITENAAKDDTAVPSSAGGPVVVIHNGRQYLVRGKLLWEGREHTPEEIRDNPRLLAHLVSIGSGMISELNRSTS